MTALNHRFPSALASPHTPLTARLSKNYSPLPTAPFIPTNSPPYPSSRSHQPALPRQLQSLNRRAARSRRIAIRNHMNRNPRLFFPLIRHANANLVHKPFLKPGTCFQCPTAHNQRIGIKSVDHFVEKQSSG